MIENIATYLFNKKNKKIFYGHELCHEFYDVFGHRTGKIQRKLFKTEIFPKLNLLRQIHVVFLSL